MSWDVIVVGTGGMGSAACWEIARRGRRVLGLDRLTPPHDLGGTHGRSRIIRKAYMEAPEYVPLLLRSYELWRVLEREAGRRVMRLTGGLMIGSPEAQAVAGSLRSARDHGLGHEMLEAAQVRRRFPPLRVPEGNVALWEDDAGVVDPESGVATFLERARAHGAELRTGVEVLGWEASDRGVEVRTANDTLRAGALVIAPGPWAPGLLADLGVPLVPSREVMHWFAPVGGVEPFLPDRFPIYIWEPDEGAIFYGFPALDGNDGGVKVALHHAGAPTDPTTVDRTVGAADVAAVRERLVSLMPELAAGDHLHGAVCLYTNTPDQHFLLGSPRGTPRVALAAGLSGHGYKFAPVIGQILAELALEGGTELPIGVFTPERFAD